MFIWVVNSISLKAVNYYLANCIDPNHLLHYITKVYCSLIENIKFETLDLCIETIHHLELGPTFPYPESPGIGSRNVSSKRFYSLIYGQKLSEI
jgi:hypothetical protein